MEQSAGTVDYDEISEYGTITEVEKLQYMRAYLSRFQGTINPILTEAMVFFESTLLEGIWKDRHQDDVRLQTGIRLAEIKRLRIAV